MNSLKNIFCGGGEGKKSKSRTKRTITIVDRANIAAEETGQNEQGQPPLQCHAEQGQQLYPHQLEQEAASSSQGVTVKNKTRKKKKSSNKGSGQDDQQQQQEEQLYHHQLEQEATSSSYATSQLPYAHIPYQGGYDDGYENMGLVDRLFGPPYDKIDTIRIE
ncbi:hypothetical protein Ancab_018720 [Ancistrocladus abbreviatus]